MSESAAPFLVPPLGIRLVKTRGAKSQPDRAAELGVHKNTYARWEREHGSIPHEALARIALEGWNINWLLTGEGPERLKDLQPATSGGGDGSQSLRTDVFKMCVEMIDEELARAGRTLPTAKRALAYQLCYEITLEEGDELPSAQVVKLATRAAA